jgi:Tfp pilus assembly protein PilO
MTIAMTLLALSNFVLFVIAVNLHYKRAQEEVECQMNMDTIRQELNNKETLIANLRRLVSEMYELNEAVSYGYNPAARELMGERIAAEQKVKYAGF